MIDIEGLLDIDQSKARLAIQIAATREPQGSGTEGGMTQPARLVNLATEIVAPLGHFTILGVTPVADKATAFAVQVMPAD